MAKNDKENMTLSDLLLIKIQSLYDIESEIIKMLPKLEKSANDTDLKNAFKNHLEETENQKKRLEEIFQLLESPSKKLKVDTIRGLATDGEWVIKNIENDSILDTALIGAASHTEHYEISVYESAIVIAEILEREDVANLLKDSLDEEKAALEKVTSLSPIIMREHIAE